MPFPIRICAICGEEFELKPGKPGFANRCLVCSEPEQPDTGATSAEGASPRKSDRELNQARKSAIRDLLYRKDS
jgi:hypothetical protein